MKKFKILLNNMKKIKKLLIAEDNDTNFKLFSICFRNLNFEIIHANNGIEAVEICKFTPDISLILMDINMPKMGGEEAAMLINKINSNIPIISLTAYRAYGEISEENKKCFVEFITKPFDIPELIKIVKKYCFDEN